MILEIHYMEYLNAQHIVSFFNLRINYPFLFMNTATVHNHADNNTLSGFGETGPDLITEDGSSPNLGQHVPKIEIHFNS